MATSDNAKVLRVPARVVINPTATTTLNSSTPPANAPVRVGQAGVNMGGVFLKTTFVFADGSETLPGPTEVSPLIPSGPTAWQATAVDLGPTGCVARRIYCTEGNPLTATFFLATTISNNTSTSSSFFDLTSAQLVVPAPSPGVFTPLPFPFGGTELGLVRSLVVRSNQLALPISAEEYGEEKVDLLDVGEDWTLECELRGLDSDAVAAVFPSHTTGPVSGRADVVYPGSTYRAGRLRSASAVKLLVVPLDTNRHPCWYFPNALPIVASSEEEDLQADKELVVRAFFQGTRDASSRVFVRRRLEDLTL